MHRVGLTWHCPSPSEASAARALLLEFCGPVLADVAAKLTTAQDRGVALTDLASVAQWRIKLEQIESCVRGAGFAMAETTSPTGLDEFVTCGSAAVASVGLGLLSDTTPLRLEVAGVAARVLGALGKLTDHRLVKVRLCRYELTARFEEHGCFV